MPKNTTSIKAEVTYCNKFCDYKNSIMFQAFKKKIHLYIIKQVGHINEQNDNLYKIVFKFYLKFQKTQPSLLNNFITFNLIRHKKRVNMLVDMSHTCFIKVQNEMTSKFRFN